MKVAVTAAAVLVLGTFPPGSDDPQALFTFQSNFWVNLQHVLRGDARRRPAGIPVVVQPDSLEPAERVAWAGALDAYADLGNRDPVFDPLLTAIHNTLTRVSGAVLPADTLPPPIRAALMTAAPVYRAHVWPAQSRVNDEWIASIEPVVSRHAAAVTERIAAAYGTKWPQQPIVVDVASEAGRNNAYTTDGPPGTTAHTTIASGVESQRGDMGVEIVFHEASHAIDAQIMKLVADACARQHVATPRDLWHALLFYTAGVIVRHELGKDRDPGYQPYADRYGVYARGWQTFRQALERDWQPHLDGEVPLAESLDRLVRDATR